MATQAASPSADAGARESRAEAMDAASAVAEPLSPKARETLRSAFLAGASAAHINNVYALGDTIGACCRAAESSSAR